VPKSILEAYFQMTAGLTENYQGAERARAQFVTLLVASDARRYGIILDAAVETGSVMPMRGPERYPGARELTTVMNHSEPEVVLLDMLDPVAAAECAECIRERFPKTVVIGIGARNFGDMTLAAPYPPEPGQLLRLISRGMHVMRGGREAGLLAFLPAKAGCGASTVALHVAGALAADGKAEGKKVLLIDADLHSGALGEMVQTEGGYSLQQLLRGISDFDKFRMEQAVCRGEQFDLLLSDGTPVSPYASWEDYFRLLEIACQRYDHVVVDLPEVVNSGTQEFIQRARGVYVVVTQELVPVKLVRRRFEELAAYGARAEDVHLIGNRWLRGELEAADIEKSVGLKVEHTFPNDHKLVKRAIETGQLIKSDNALGRAYRDFALTAAGCQQKRSGSLLGSLFGR
jgi:Mrp family chromosome partitioning ATPase